MEQMEQLLQRRPGNQFLIAHFCSWPSNLDFVEQLLARYANLYTDCAATLSELGRQPRRFRRFMEKFPDRVLFGTDNFCATNPPHLPYFRFFETEDEYFPYGDTLEHGRWRIYGCALPDWILRKLYYENATRFFRLDGGME